MDLFSAKFLFLAFIAMIVLGPDKLPSALRTAGRLMAELKKITADLTDQSRTVMNQAGLSEPLDELRSVTTSARQPFLAARAEIFSAIVPSGTAAPTAAFDTPVSGRAGGPADATNQDQLELQWPRASGST